MTALQWIVFLLMSTPNNPMRVFEVFLISDDNCMDDVPMLIIRGPSGFRLGIYTAINLECSLSVGV